MTFRKRTLLVCLFAPFGILACNAQTPADANLIETLKAKLAAQQTQIEQLRLALQEQQKLLESLTQAAPMAAAPAPPKSAETAAPVSISLGAAKFTPFGFIDLTEILRSKDIGSGMPTNFGAVPFSNTALGQLSESRLTAQNSRFGVRVDSAVLGWNVLGYLETDFLGNPPGNLLVTANGNTLRMRLAFVDTRKGKFEMLGGQSWSMLTPNLKGLSPLPADISIGAQLDPNLHVGVPWSRDPQFRVVYHPSDAVTLGVSAESPEQYIGSAVTLPPALASTYNTEFNNGTNTSAVPNRAPDVVAKVAFDGGHSAHLEIAGLLRTFRAYNPASDRHFRTTGGGGSVNFGFDLVKGLRVLSENFAGAGGGRYLVGVGPDLVIRPDGDISLVRAFSTRDGLEFTRSHSVFYGYYGGDYFGRNYALGSSGFTGYGFPNGSLGANRMVQEATLGYIRTFWKSPSWGDLKFISQLSFLRRNPWSTGHASATMLFLNLRYDIP